MVNFEGFPVFIVGMLILRFFANRNLVVKTGLKPVFALLAFIEMCISSPVKSCNI